MPGGLQFWCYLLGQLWLTGWMYQAAGGPVFKNVSHAIATVAYAALVTGVGCGHVDKLVLKKLRKNVKKNSSSLTKHGQKSAVSM